METRTDALLDTKGVTVAYSFPTPRQTTGWGCAEYDDPAVFDPVDEEALATARAVCAGCPVRATCLDLGTSRDEWGVWGGVLLESGRPIDRVRTPGRPKKIPAKVTAA